MRRSLVLMLTALMAVALLAVPASAASTAKITVVHGIPGDALGLAKALPVDRVRHRALARQGVTPRAPQGCAAPRRCPGPSGR